MLMFAASAVCCMFAAVSGRTFAECLSEKGPSFDAAKRVASPRVLVECGYADDAYRMFVQPEMPGWAHWLQFGDGTLRENWDDVGSHNHIMFGDLSAWAYEYVAGIVPTEPGFKKIAFRPHVLEGVDSFVVTHKTPFGEVRAGWRRVGGEVEYVCEAPDGIEVEKIQ